MTADVGKSDDAWGQRVVLSGVKPAERNKTQLIHVNVDYIVNLLITALLDKPYFLSCSKKSWTFMKPEVSYNFCKNRPLLLIKFDPRRNSE